ncbi:mitochondrial fission ELM1 family protein [Rhodobacteraceae bacterium NNCM2]|nr:mitochondrial fission ELM1 family protein [Coraliihabitans acroporae]
MTDGNAGNAAQAMALAEAMSRLTPIELETCKATLAGWAAALPPGLLHASRLARLGVSGGSLPERAELVIGAGRRAAPLVAALGRQQETATVQLMNPQMPLTVFDAVIAPAHDQLEGENVLNSIGALSRLTPATVASAARDWRSRVPSRGPRVAVMVGGPSKSATFGMDEAKVLLKALKALAEDHSLMITTSRRTPGPMAEELKRQFGRRHLVWIGEGDNPYPAILGLADFAIVTADSVNMASEAASTGKPVYIFPLPGLNAKLKRFHESLAAHGASRPYDGLIEHWTYPPLAEADRAARWLRDRLGWKRA